MLRANSASLLATNGLNEGINLAGGVAARYALLLAPLALVQAVTSTRALFVFLFGVALSVINPAFAQEDLSLRSLSQKAACAAVAGFGAVLAGSQESRLPRGWKPRCSLPRFGHCSTFGPTIMKASRSAERP